MNFALILVAIIGGLSGGLATLYICISFPAMIVWKIYRRMVHKIPVMK